MKKVYLFLFFCFFLSFSLAQEALDKKPLKLKIACEKCKAIQLEYSARNIFNKKEGFFEIYRIHFIKDGKCQWKEEKRHFSSWKEYEKAREAIKKAGGRDLPPEAYIPFRKGLDQILMTNELKKLEKSQIFPIDKLPEPHFEDVPKEAWYLPFLDTEGAPRTVEIGEMIYGDGIEFSLDTGDQDIKAYETPVKRSFYCKKCTYSSELRQYGVNHDQKGFYKWYLNHEELKNGTCQPREVRNYICTLKEFYEAYILYEKAAKKEYLNEEEHKKLPAAKKLLQKIGLVEWDITDFEKKNLKKKDKK